MRLNLYCLVYGYFYRKPNVGGQNKNKTKFLFEQFGAIFGNFDVGGWKKLISNFLVLLFYSTKNVTTQDRLKLFSHLLFVSNCNLLPRRKTKSASRVHTTVILLFSLTCLFV